MSRPGIDFTGISVRTVCTDGAGRFLLQKRSLAARDEHGMWEFGGGHLEFGKSLIDGALRELQEEYGCRGVVLEQLPPFDSVRTYEGEMTHWLFVPLVIKVDPKEVQVSGDPAVEEIGWFALNALPEPLLSGAQHTLRHHRRSLEKHARKKLIG